MTEGEKTMRRLIAETPDPRTDSSYWLAWITLINAVTLTYLAHSVYLPIARIIF
jgi:hypothetical protein